MELEELKSAWKTTNARLDEMEVMQSLLIQTVQQDRTKSAARRLSVEPIFELIVAIPTAFWSGGFLARNFAKIQAMPAGAIPMLMLYALSIFTIILSIVQLVKISNLDYSKPVVEAQTTIAQLRAIRVRSTQLVLLVSIPCWMIFPMILLQGLAGYDVIKIFSGPWVMGNVIVGAVISLIFVGCAKLFGSRSRFFRFIDEALAGSEVVKAQELLAEVRQFAKD